MLRTPRHAPHSAVRGHLRRPPRTASTTRRAGWTTEKSRDARQVEFSPAIFSSLLEARSDWIAWSAVNNTHLERSTGVRAGIYAKLRTHVARFELIIHCLAHPTNPAGVAVLDQTMAVSGRTGRVVPRPRRTCAAGIGARRFCGG